MPQRNCASPGRRRAGQGGEADQEFVIANLVVSGVGLSLIREELALERKAAGEVCLWRDVRLETDLWFIYRGGRDSDPVIRVMLDVLIDTWKPGVVQSLRSRASVQRDSEPA